MEYVRYKTDICASNRSVFGATSPGESYQASPDPMTPTAYASRLAWVRRTGPRKAVGKRTLGDVREDKAWHCPHPVWAGGCYRYPKKQKRRREDRWKKRCSTLPRASSGWEKNQCQPGCSPIPPYGTYQNDFLIMRLDELVHRRHLPEWGRCIIDEVKHPAWEQTRVQARVTRE